MKQKTLTLKQLYKVGTVKLAEEGIEEFSLDAWYLLEHIYGIGRVDFLMRRSDSFDAAQMEKSTAYQALIGAQRIFHCSILRVNRNSWVIRSV